MVVLRVGIGLLGTNRSSTMGTKKFRRLVAAVCIAGTLAAGVGAAAASPVDPHPTGGGGWGTPRDPRRDPGDPGPREPTEECDDDGNCQCIPPDEPPTAPPETSPPSVAAADC